MGHVSGVIASLRRAAVETQVIRTPLHRRNGVGRLRTAAARVPNSDGSRSFGSPTKLSEYMAMGRAIVASDLEQIGTVLQHRESAILVPPGDVGELARALVEPAGSPERRAELGAAALAALVARHTWDRHTARILDALSDRLGTPRP